MQPVKLPPFSFFRSVLLLDDCAWVTFILSMLSSSLRKSSQHRQVVWFYCILIEMKISVADKRRSSCLTRLNSSLRTCSASFHHCTFYPTSRCNYHYLILRSHHPGTAGGQGQRWSPAENQRILIESSLALQSLWKLDVSHARSYLRAAPEKSTMSVRAPEAQRDSEWLLGPDKQRISGQSWMQRGWTDALQVRSTSVSGSCLKSVTAIVYFKARRIR